MMHAIGFDNHWTGELATPNRPSVLAMRYDPARTAAFSPWDLLAIRVLYDPRLKPGMDRRTAMALAHSIINELSANRLVEDGRDHRAPDRS